MANILKRGLLGWRGGPTGLLAPVVTRLSLRQNSDSSRNTLLDPAIGLTSEQRQIQRMAYSFAISEMRPHMREWDEKEYFPKETLRRAAQLGFGSLYTASEHGGTGLSRLETSVVIEALAQGCVSTTAYLSIHNMCCWMVGEFGNDVQRAKYIPALASMEKFASYCLTEPGAGSDASSLRTTATLKDDHYVINGTKAFISGAGAAGDKDGVFLVMCRTGVDGPKGISCILIDADTPGLSLGVKEKKLGWNSHPARMLILEDCKVPVTNRLGNEGFGFNIAMQGLNGGRVNIASCSLGGAQWALEEAINYTTVRKQFNTRISDFQNTQFQLAWMASELFNCRLAARAAASALDLEKTQKPDASDYEIASTVHPGTLGAVAKLLVTEKCYQIIDSSLQLFGGYGYLYDFPLQQILRDCRVHRILEGTNEIMKVIIARDLLSKHM